MAILRSQFIDALTRIEVNGTKKARAIEAHTEVQNLLASDDVLQSWGLDTALIGSYKRDTAIYPGKDVDLFARLKDLDTAAMPREVYERVEQVVTAEYGSRATPQNRSVKIDFGSDGFSIDAVPAVRDGERWAVPTKDRSRWAASTGRWHPTDPLHFAQLSSDLSTAAWTPEVGGRHAYKPIMKLLRQARRTHLGDDRPGGLYVEFAAYDVWSTGRVAGVEWDTLFARSLREVAIRFGNATLLPLIDPGMGSAVDPPLDDSAWQNAQAVFARLADLADEALDADKCMAAAKWREILGKNDRGPVFTPPPGCDANGFAIGQVAAIGGTGLDSARRFA